MPPITRTLGLILVLLSPTCLAGQTPTPGNRGYNPAQTPAAQQSGAWTDQTGHASAFEAAPSQSGVVPAAFESPARSTGTPPPPGRLERPRDSAMPQTPGGTPAAPSLPPRGHGSLPSLTPRGSSGGSNRDDRLGGLTSLMTMGGSLATVLGLFLVVAWAMRRSAPRGSVLLPDEVVEMLGRAPLTCRQQVHLLRCGNKLLLVCVTPSGVETLTEVTDPEEVDRLAGLCRQAHPDSATNAFRQVLQQFSGQRNVARHRTGEGAHV